jgi:hypothetical protein
MAEMRVGCWDDSRAALRAVSTVGRKAVRTAVPTAVLKALNC